MNCDNTDHKGKTEDVKLVKLTKDFGNDECYWCKSCRERDMKMIEE